jgi:allantoate deiminase
VTGRESTGADSSVSGVSVILDGDRLLARLAQLQTIGATEAGGVTREAYGHRDVEARTLVAAWMAEAGLDHVVDAATNLVGRRTAGAGRVLVTGSHLDTVVDAGPLDGAYGVVAAVEVAAALGQRGLSLHHDLVVVAFANEEGARGTDGMAGSRALFGDVSAEELAALDDGGVSLSQRLADAGGDPAHIATAAWDRGAVAAFVELHIEQGPVLDTGGWPVGVVTGITGRQAVDIELRGDANHAGTTPMELRRDALVAAAEVVVAIESLAGDGVVRVATCGHLRVQPNVRNVVPSRVVVSAELRDEDPTMLAAAQPAVEAVVRSIGERRGIDTTITWRQYVAPTAADAAVVDVIEQAAKRSGVAWRTLPSGAGHDAQILGASVPMGMIFVPSVAGISHAPDERTDPGHLVIGAQLLLESIVGLDRRLSSGPPP